MAAWSVDRLGHGLCKTSWASSKILRSHGAALYLHQQALDTTTPSGRVLFGIMAFAEFEWAIIRMRVNADPARAKVQGKRHGRPTVGGDIEAKVRELLTAGIGVVKVAKRPCSGRPESNGWARS